MDKYIHTPTHAHTHKEAGTETETETETATETATETETETATETETETERQRDREVKDLENKSFLVLYGLVVRPRVGACMRERACACTLMGRRRTNVDPTPA